MPKLTASASWFLLVGALAALVHYVIAVSLESTATLLPAYANIVGFLLAFPISYVGHSQLTFADHGQTHTHALPRFLAIASTGFVFNQALLLSSLRFTALPFWVALAIVMVIVAVSTYVLSRFWAFKTK